MDTYYTGWHKIGQLKNAKVWLPLIMDIHLKYGYWYLVNPTLCSTTNIDDLRQRVWVGLTTKYDFWWYRRQIVGHRPRFPVSRGAICPSYRMMATSYSPLLVRGTVQDGLREILERVIATNCFTHSIDTTSSRYSHPSNIISLSKIQDDWGHLVRLG